MRTVLLAWAFVTLALLVAVVANAAPPAAAHQYRAQITREAQARFGIPAPVPMIAGQIEQESAWNPKARSPVGAIGLMQFMPATARWADTANAWGAVDPTNPAWAIRAGVWYDRWLFERVRKADSTCDRWLFALSAYNGGLAYVYRRQRASTAPGSYAQTGTINPGIAPANQRENERYAPAIVKRSFNYSSWGTRPCSA